MTDMTDPRVTEYREARAAVDAGLSGGRNARERYRESLFPYCECMSEIVPEDDGWARKALMAALYEGGLPLGVIAAAFKATSEEFDYVVEHPPVQAEPVDEQQRLSSLPYGMYLRTAHWKSVRMDALRRAGNRCALCNDHRNGLEVHHRTYRRLGAERPGDVIVLCATCHSRHHGQLRAA